MTPNFQIKIILINLLLRDSQGSKGIRQLPINLCTSPMSIHKITPSVDYNWLKRLNTQLNEPTNQNEFENDKLFNWSFISSF